MGTAAKEGVRGRAKVTPAKDALFLPYQEKWIRDTSRLKLMEKSRQIGISWSTAYAAVSRQSKKTARLDQWVSSRDDLQARLFIEDCKAFASVLDIAATDLGERAIDDKGKLSAYVLSFSNGTRIHSMSSNPDAQAGKRGGRILDEFALHPDPRKLWTIAYPGITWGGGMEVISTHRGSHNYFNELVTEAKHKGNPKKLSLHRVTLQDALDQGFLYKLQQKLADGDERLDFDEVAYFDFIKRGCTDDESFNQEYMCVPADDNAAFLSYDLIATCALRGEDSLTIATEETIDFAGRKGSIRTLGKLDMVGIALLPFPLFVGVDIGREHDLTVLWLAARIGGALFPLRIVEMARVEFDRQEKELYAMLDLRNTLRCCIDNTGIGRQLCERTQKRYGQYRVEAITFTGHVKEQLAYPVRMGFEDRSLRVPDDDQVTSDLRAIRKETTAAGNIRFTADRGKNGHSDRFWALALAIHAASSMAAGPVVVETVPVRDMATGLEEYQGSIDLSTY